MAMAFVVEVANVTAQEYESVTRKVNESGSPAGCMFHAGGPIEGGIRFIEVWESADAAQAFYTSQLLREATAAVGGANRDEEPKILMTWPVRGLDDGTGWRPVG